MAAKRNKWPIMVRISLWGLPNRAVAWAFVALSITIAVGGVVYGLVDHRYFIGSLMVFAALWYYLSIRWVDQNSGWS